MTRNKYGVFEILVDPNADGKVAIPHGSKIKVILYKIELLQKEVDKLFCIRSL